MPLESGYLRGCPGFNESGIEAGAEPLAKPGIRRLFDISRFLAHSLVCGYSGSRSKRGETLKGSSRDEGRHCATITAVPATV